jgi:hypothetical protein
MCRRWLKMIGCGDPGQGCPEDWALTHDCVHFRGRRPRSIRPGDRLVLYACGGSRRVFALATVTSEVYDSREEEGWPYQMDVSWTVRRNVSDGVPIEQVNVPGGRDLLDTIRTGHSYFSLSPEEYDRAASLLQQRAQQFDETAQQ